MIYTDDNISLDRVVEAIYLEEEFDNRLSYCNIHVNPINPTYIIGKTVIINSVDYPKENIEVLRKNNCKIYYRISLTKREKLYQYIDKPYFDIMWNGQEIVINNREELNNLLSNNSSLGDWNVSFPDYKLYFPKLFIKDKSLHSLLMDEDGNLSYLGWLLYQVGLNLCNSKFKDLDIIKSKKVTL